MEIFLISINSIMQINATRKGLITVMLMIAMSLFFFYTLKKPFDSSFQYIIYSIYFFGILWNMLIFNKQADINTRFKDYFSEAFKTFIVITLIMVIYNLIFLKFNPQILELKIVQNNVEILKEGNHTPAEIVDNANQMRSIFLPMMAAINIFLYLILGTIMSSVISLVLMKMKKK